VSISQISVNLQTYEVNNDIAYARKIGRFLREDDCGPAVTLNLLSFNPAGGYECYQEYLRMACPIVDRVGAEIVFVGDGLSARAAKDDHSWDAVVLVRSGPATRASRKNQIQAFGTQLESAGGRGA
jgi:hypothetical protein